MHDAVTSEPADGNRKPRWRVSFLRFDFTDAEAEEFIRLLLSDDEHPESASQSAEGQNLQIEHNSE